MFCILSCTSFNTVCNMTTFETYVYIIMVYDLRTLSCYSQLSDKIQNYSYWSFDIYFLSSQHPHPPRDLKRKQQGWCAGARQSWTCTIKTTVINFASMKAELFGSLGGTGGGENNGWKRGREPPRLDTQEGRGLLKQLVTREQLILS